MNQALEKLLKVSRDAHIPMPLDESETVERRLLEKPVLESRLLDDMEDLSSWRPVTDYVTMSLSEERCISGCYSLRMEAPCNLDDWRTEAGRGRIYAEPGVMRVFDREDWRDFNRLSVWVYPHVPGMKSLSFRVQLHNDGEHKVPDIFFREGHHNVSLKPDEWNHIVLEFPYLHRDCVTGVSFEYDMCGHENDSADHGVWYIDRLELQKVKADVYEGWIPGEDRIAFSGSGYQPGSRKLAVASGLAAEQFRLLEMRTGRVVFTGPIEQVEGHTGSLQVMDFTPVMEPGRYMIAAGEVFSRAFDIGDDVWESSVWKVLNFFLSQRCGYEVPGKHRACHRDLLLRHGDKAIVANGGWHDAADLAQGMENTAEGTAGLFLLAEALKGRNERLYARVMEEARWGLDYVLKVRFGDGYRSSYSSTSIWTDGIIGTCDDILSKPTRQPLPNFLSAHAEAIGARMVRDTDPVLADYALRIAMEDFGFAEEAWENPPDGKLFSFPVHLAGAATAAAAELCRAGAGEAYGQKAAAYARRLIACQQRIYTDWDIPMRGFFYRDESHTLILHHNHFSFDHYTSLGLESLCRLLPEHKDAMLWYASLALLGEYQLKAAQYTAPYGMLPESIYHEAECETFGAAVLPSIIQGRGGEQAQYRKQVEEGIPLGKGYYLRCFPVWFSFRGNFNVQLSTALSVAAGASLRSSQALYRLHQQQYEWIVGKNPFAQSVLYGEGYEYTQQYAVQPGQTVGQLCVGIESLFEADRPYWPQVATATYKEVWITPAIKWVWNMRYDLLPARVRGQVRPDGGSVTFTRQDTGRVYEAAVDPDFGAYDVELPAGVYLAAQGEEKAQISIVCGKTYRLDLPFVHLSGQAERRERQVRIALRTDCGVGAQARIRAYNVAGLPERLVLSEQDELTGVIQDPQQAAVILITAMDGEAVRLEWLL